MARKTSAMVSSSLRTMGIITIMTSLLWTSVGIYNAFKEPVNLEVSASILSPVNPNLDMETIKALQDRRQLSENAGADAAIREALQILLIEPEEETAATESAVEETVTAEPEISVEASEAATPEPAL